MIELPDPAKSWDDENGFHLTCKPERIGKLLMQAAAYKATLSLPGALVECGVFKGASLCRWAAFREISGTPAARELIGFDLFDSYAEPAPTSDGRDEELREAVVEGAGQFAISVGQLYHLLRWKSCAENVTLIDGDILRTVPEWASNNPEKRIALLNLDVDFYEPAMVVLETLWPPVVKGGIVLLDDYRTFAGETRAADEFFGPLGVEIRKESYCYSPSYVVKR